MLIDHFVILFYRNILLFNYFVNYFNKNIFLALIMNMRYFIIIGALVLLQKPL